MSDSNRVNLAYVKEVTYGTIPGTQMKNLRFTSESLGQDTDSTSSQEIRSDRQVTDLVRTNIKSSGELNGEMSYGAHDDFMEWGLQSAAWSAAVVTAASPTSLAIGVASGVATITRVTGSFTTDGFVVGGFIYTTNFTNASNNGMFGPILSVGGTTMTVAAGAMIAETADSNATCQQINTIANGTTANSFFVEKQFQDLSNKFARYRGQMVDGFKMQFGATEIATCGFTMMGIREESSAVTGGTGTNLAAATGNVMNGIDNVNSFLEGGTAQTGILSLNLQVANNLRARNQIGTLGAVSIGSGTVAVTGTMQAYFTSETLVDKYLNWTQSSIRLVTIDAALDYYLFDLPAVKYSNARRVASGLNQDVIMDMAFTAFMHPTYGKTIYIGRIPL
ncbi:putative major tail structural protein [Caudoviricetes sp.]|nr:putative major tail structural protein [Caudoviricetes sp.]UOF82719.1 putative major tail structural protein [Caudoviricetes sp.]